MVCENDILEIPEKYKKMSEEELDKEIEKLYETMKGQNKGEVKEKVAKLPVKFKSAKCPCTARVEESEWAFRKA